MGVFGAQQSVLESVLLKRRIMGPSWISLSCPIRIDASKQARPLHLLHCCNCYYTVFLPNSKIRLANKLQLKAAH